MEFDDHPIWTRLSIQSPELAPRAVDPQPGMVQFVDSPN